VAFYVSGFFATANVLSLNTREVAIGLFAGTIAGLSVLIGVLVTNGEPASRRVL
jgi:hypothetical protein